MEVDFPRKQVVPQLAVANTQKNSKDHPQPKTHSSEAGNSRNSLTQDHTENILPSQQESQTLLAIVDLTATMISHSVAKTTWHGSTGDPPFFYTHGSRERGESFHERHFATLPPNLKFPFYRKAILTYKPY